MEQSLVLSIDVCPGIGISPLQQIWLGFLWPILAQDRARNYFVLFFFSSFKHFFRRFVLIANGTEIFRQGIFEIQISYGNIAFPLSPV